MEMEIGMGMIMIMMGMGMVKVKVLVKVMGTEFVMMGFCINLTLCVSPIRLIQHFPNRLLHYFDAKPV